MAHIFCTGSTTCLLICPHEQGKLLRTAELVSPCLPKKKPRCLFPSTFDWTQEKFSFLLARLSIRGSTAWERIRGGGKMAGLHETISPCLFSLDVEQARPGVTSDPESWCKSFSEP